MYNLHMHMLHMTSGGLIKVWVNSKQQVRTCTINLKAVMLPAEEVLFLDQIVLIRFVY